MYFFSIYKIYRTRDNDTDLSVINEENEAPDNFEEADQNNSNDLYENTRTQPRNIRHEFSVRRSQTPSSPIQSTSRNTVQNTVFT